MSEIDAEGIDTGVGRVMQVKTAGEYPLVDARVLEESWVFDASRDIDGKTVTIYPPDVVVVKRVINQGRHLICRFAGGPLCVMARKRLEFSEVRFS